MAYTVKLVWKIFGRLADGIRLYEVPIDPRNGDRSRDESNLLFNVKTGKSFLRGIGGGAKNTLVPHVLDPTHIFYNSLRPTIISHHQSLQGKKFPIEIKFNNTYNLMQSVRVNFKINAYERILSLSIETDEFEVDDPLILPSLQLLENHIDLIQVAKKVLVMAETRNRRADIRNGALNVIPCIQIVATPGENDLTLQFLARLVTGHGGANDLLINSQVAKNEVHQIDSTTLFCDRQGVVAFVPASANEDERTDISRRFRSASSMSELGAVIQKLLDSNDTLSDETLDAIQTVINDSDIVFANSTSARTIWRLFLDEFTLAPFLKRKIKMQELNNKRLESKGIVLCMAAATIEFKTIHSFLENSFGVGRTVKLGHGKNYDVAFSYLDTQTGMTWCLAPQLFQGVTSAAVDVQRIADAIQPQIVLMIGMCMGMPNKELIPGTVIVPNSITLFDHQRFRDSATEYRPRSELIATGLYNVARLAAIEDGLPFKVIVDKGLACATVKIEDTESGLVPFISSYLPDVVAFDMEGWGFYQGTSKYESLWIKAVADSGESQLQDEKMRSEKQVAQAAVTKNAITFALKVVKSYSEL